MGYTCVNRIAPDIGPQKGASHLGLFYLLTKNSSNNEMKVTTDAPRNQSGLIQFIRMWNFIQLIGVKGTMFA